jgi:cell wall-associated NlpC family hydrolase
MKNRKSLLPILSAIAFSFLASALSSRADLSVPGGSTPAPMSPVSAQYVPAKTTAATPASLQAVATPSTPVLAPVPRHTTEYTVVKGDSLTKIALKFNTTRKKLRELNNLPASVVAVKPGEILLVPSSGKSASAIAATAKARAHRDYLRAQPVQDFDIPASTFASCPVPLPSEDQDAEAAAAQSQKTEPVAASPSSAEPAEIPAPIAPAPALAPQNTSPLTSSNYSAQHSPKPAPAYLPGTAPSGLRNPMQPFNPPAPRLTIRGINPGPNPAATTAPGTNNLATRFIQEARLLGDMGIEYDDDWRPPGETHAWTMDCSNTTRYIYKVTTGIQLPRTASDQYYYLHLQGKAWDVPQTSAGWADTNYLRQNLKPGDLLFWENTYRPERQPPITHVMVFLGTNERGQWIMAGSQSSRGGEHNRRNGGPDIYIFRPSQACGGYTTWLGMVHHQGRFCAFGRPLEADRSKLSVAESN